MTIEPQDTTASPDGAEASYRLGLAAEARGDTAGAVEHILRAVEGDLRRPEAARALARLCYLAGSQDESLAALDILFRASPGDPFGRNLLGLISLRRGAVPFAATVFRSCVEADPASVEARVNLAICDRILGRLEDSRAGLEAACRMGRGVPEPAVELALTLEAMGRGDEALESLREVVALCPRDSRTVAAFVRVATHADELELARAAVERCAAPSSAGVAERQAFHFAAAELFDRLGEPDRAFEHARRANGLSWRGFDAHAHTLLTERIIAAFTPTRLARAPDSGVHDERPVFIVGMPRSGTSLMERVLAAHPAIATTGEHREIGRIVGSLSSGADGASYLESMARIDRPALGALARRYLDSLPPSDGALRIIDKTPANFLHLGPILRLFPNACIVHMVRAPMDTCLSCYFQSFAEGHEFTFDLESLGRFYADYRRLMDHWRAVLPGRILDVCYEDLVADFEGQSRRVLDTLGLPWDDRLRAFHSHGGPVATASYHQVRRPLYTDSVGRWRGYARHLAPLAETLRRGGVAVA